MRKGASIKQNAVREWAGEAFHLFAHPIISHLCVWEGEWGSASESMGVRERKKGREIAGDKE